MIDIVKHCKGRPCGPGIFESAVDRARERGEDDARARVWVGSRQLEVHLASTGLWLPLSEAAAKGCWAPDLRGAAAALTARGLAPTSAPLWQYLTAWYDMVDAVRLLPTVLSSPLGGVYLLPDPEQTRPGRYDGRPELRWLPVRAETRRRAR